MSKKMTAFGSKFIQTSKAVSKKRQKLAETVGLEGAVMGEKKAKVSRCMVEILLCLDQSKTPQAVRDVSFDTEYSKGMISRCVENLRQQGYVTVERNVQDRRAVCIALTEKAKPVIADFHAKEKEMIETLYAGLNDADIQDLDRILEIVQANIADM
jgi:hypothetical protein